MAEVYEYKKIVKEGDAISASAVMATNGQSVQANLERIDGEINRVEAKIGGYKITAVTETSDSINVTLTAVQDA